MNLLHHRFEAIAKATPEAIAIEDAADRLTYGEVDARAEVLAGRLAGAGVVPGDLVALCIERSVDIAVAIMAVWKAGAAYLPLDPDYPDERLAFMLEDASPRLLLTQSQLRSRCAEFALADLQTLDVAGHGPHKDIDQRAIHADGSGLAYVIYTSGSTGRPKGVMVEHRTVAHLADVLEQEAHHLLPSDGRVALNAPLSFDASVPPLTHLLFGRTLVLVPQDVRLDHAGMLAYVQSKQLHAIDVTPSQLQGLLSAGLLEHLQDLQLVIVGGEAFPPSLWSRMAKSGIAVFNCYGPTECTVQATIARVEGDVPHLGHALPDVLLKLVDGEGREVAAGEEGVLWIGGAQVSRGYLNRPDLNAQRFRDFHGGRWYDSGDVCRIDAQGRLIYLGRSDAQVKLRGHRIELEEIEACIAEHPELLDAVVTVKGEGVHARLVAYVVPRGNMPSHGELRRHAAARLSEAMIPAAWVAIRRVPLAPTGKRDRAALPDPSTDRPDLSTPYVPPRDTREAVVCEAFAAVLGMKPVGRDDGFFELGGTSLLATLLVQQLSGDFPALKVIDLFAAATPAMLLERLQSRPASPRAPSPRPASGNDAIAIIGMVGRFPGADDVDHYWQNLLDGVDSITHFDRLDPSISAELASSPGYVAARGRLPDADCFDAAFFGISAREAQLMDPQQRVFLELCWQCMESGAQVPGSGDRVGVFAGVNNPTYLYRHLIPTPALQDDIGDLQVVMGNEKDYVATRVAYRLDLRGPAVSVHTACSTSLVAICQAVASLRSGHCDMALAGGASIVCPLESGYVHVEGGMLSPDGRTRSFDAEAAGTVFGDGAGVVLLKRLADAVRDGDPVRAVIRGIGINNDGGARASFTAPSAEGQAEVVAMAHADAGIGSDEVGYVEAHGTATPLGDPIEIEGLTRAFRASGTGVGHCAIGSAKSNIGHAVTAAGVAGLIKAVRVVETGLVPATLHYEHPNPAIPFEGSPFHVVAGGTQDWSHPGQARVAGVSCFGVGGTNAHVVIESAPELPSSEPGTDVALLCLSARTLPTLNEMAVNLAQSLKGLGDESLADAAWTLARGRKPMPKRMCVTASNVADAVVKLGMFAGATTASVAPAASSHTAWLFTGQGAQYPGMGRALAGRFNVFAAALEECAHILKPLLGRDIRDFMWDEDAEALLPTAIMQPALFAFEYALSRLWQAAGARPDVMLGHSLGEFVAATLAGVFSLEDALRLVAGRGALMQSMPAGGMLTLRLPAAQVRDMLDPSLCIAAENAPSITVVSGPRDALDLFAKKLSERDVPNRMLATSHAFHSSMMQPMVEPLRDLVSTMKLQAPGIPLVSSVTGNWMSPEQASSADYWARQAVEPVRFASAVMTLRQDRHPSFIEIGPRRTLVTLARAQLQAAEFHVIGSGGDSAACEVEAWMQGLGEAWCAGLAVDPSWPDQRSRRRKLCLPAYPFARTRHWIDAPAAKQQPSAAAASPALGVATDATVKLNQLEGDSMEKNKMQADPAVVATLQEMVSRIMGRDVADIAVDASFVDLGMDSLVLTQLATQVQRRFNQKVSFRQLMSELPSIRALALGLAPEVEVAAPAPSLATEASVQSASSVAVSGLTPPLALSGASGHADPSTILGVVQQQMWLMQRQLELLGGVAATGASAPQVAQSDAAKTNVQAALTSRNVLEPLNSTEEGTKPSQISYDVKTAFGAIARIHATSSGVDELQQQRLSRLIERYVARTPKSKAYNQEYRACMADPRVVSGFRPQFKELVYQTVMDRSKGARLWDIDGNEYVDANNGFGMSLFGWQPEFVLRAVREQLDRGYEIGPQTPLVGEVAKLMCELTGHDRAAFCNTGSEAVLGAIRIARTATGRDTIVTFAGSYHGVNDEVLVRGSPSRRATPAVPGVLQSACENVVVLDYGTPESLDHLRGIIDDVACVLVEPVQSRNPDLRPVEFLKELRKLTSEHGTVLVFDEIITGFRSHPGGTQALFGIQADVATYGKVIGGGFPIGAICGKREFMDVLDGGHWSYGDDSAPTVGVTYFAGTFVRHPLAIAAAHAALTHMKEQGPALQEDLNAKMEAFTARLNAHCEKRGAPLRVAHFASLWRVRWLEEHPLQDLLFAMMRLRGVHILDNFPCFFTTAHTQSDIDEIATAFEQAVDELQESGFVPRLQTQAAQVEIASLPPEPGARLGRDQDGKPAWFVRDTGGALRKVG